MSYCMIEDIVYESARLQSGAQLKGIGVLKRPQLKGVPCNSAISDDVLVRGFVT